jgi:HK97 family phage major capsid protein
MEEIKKIASEINDSIEAKANTFNAKVDAVEKAFEAKLEEKSNEVSSLKAEIKIVADRAEQLDAKLAKAKESEAKQEVKSFGEQLSSAVAEVGGGNYEKGVKEIELALKSANGSFSIPMHVKVVGDMTTSGSLTGDPVRTYNSRQGLVPFQKVNMRDLIPTVQSATGTFVTYRETGSEGSISTQTEGSGKSQIDYDLTEIVTVNNYIAGFARFSKQLMKNLPFLEGTLSRMLLRDFYKAENSAFFTTVSGAATGSGTVATTTSDIEAIIELVANQLAANFNPSYALVNPKQMARLQKETFTNGYYAGAGAVSLTPNGINIAGMPVLPASWVTDNYILIIDQDYLERVEVESMNVVFSYEDGTNFTTNKVTARIECQEAVNTLRVDSLIYKDLTAIS